MFELATACSSWQDESKCHQVCFPDQNERRMGARTFQGPLPIPLEPLMASSVWGMMKEFVFCKETTLQHCLNHPSHDTAKVHLHASPLATSKSTRVTVFDQCKSPGWALLFFVLCFARAHQGEIGSQGTHKGQQGGHRGHLQFSRKI